MLIKTIITINGLLKTKKNWLLWKINVILSEYKIYITKIIIIFKLFLQIK